MKRIVTALWLLHAALPLLAIASRPDPLACCRAKAAHGCFLRRVVPPTSAAGKNAAVVGGDTHCGARQAKATQEARAALSTVSPKPQPSIDVATHFVATRTVRDRGRDVRSARAPPRLA